MPSQSLMQELNTVFKDVFDNDSIQIHEKMTAADVDDWDSLNHINLVVAVEKRFNVKFTTKEIMSFANVGEFANSLEAKLSK